MKQQTYSSDIKTMFFENMKRFWAVSLFPFLLMLFSGPIFIALATENRKDALKMFRTFAVEPHPGFIIAMMFLAVAAGIACFKYLQTAQESSYVHSLPLTRKNLFIVSFVSGLVLIAAPAALNALICMIAGATALYLKWFINAMMFAFVLYSVTVFAAFISGNMLMHFANIAILTHLVPGFILLLIGYADCFLKGYSSEAAFSKLGKTYLFTSLLAKKPGPDAFVHLAVAVVLVILAYWLYTRRQIEKTGSSYVFDSLNWAALAAAAFIGASTFGVGMASLELMPKAIGFTAFALLGTLLAAITANILIFRDLKLFERKKLLSCLAAFALCLVIGFSLMGMSSGFSKKHPSAENVKYVLISEVPGIEPQGYNSEFYKGSKEEMAMFKDRKNIETVIKMQEIAADQPNVNSDEEYDGYWFRIRYVTKNGKSVERYYDKFSMKDKRLEKAAFDIMDSKEFKNIYSIDNLNGPVKNVELVDMTAEENYIPVKKGSDRDSLIAALKKDMKNRTSADLTSTKNSTKWQIYVAIGGREDYSNNIDVLSCDKNTLKWINSHVK